MKIIQAMKHIRDTLIKGNLLCEVVAVGMLDDLIKQEEAQTVEPIGQRVNNATLGHPIVWWREVEPGTLLFTHPAPADERGEVVVTFTQDGQIQAVTRQDEEGRILSVIAESKVLQQSWSSFKDWWKVHHESSANYKDCWDAAWMTK